MRQLARVTMTMRDLDRLKCIQAVVDGNLKPGRAAERLGLTGRQVRRLTRRYAQEGPVGLISRHRNRPSNNRLDPGLAERVISASCASHTLILARHWPRRSCAATTRSIWSRRRFANCRLPPGCGFRGACARRRYSNPELGVPVSASWCRSMAATIVGSKTGRHRALRWYTSTMQPVD